MIKKDTADAVEEALEINLKSYARHLTDVVERLYQKPTYIERVKTSDSALVGVSKVMPDGEPRIQVSGYALDFEATFVHELHHLRLRAKGYPRYTAIYPRDGSVKESTLYFLFSELPSILQHMHFFYDMRQAGYDQGSQFVPIYHSLSNAKDLNFDSEIPLALVIARIKCEVMDDELLKATIQRFRELGQGQAVAIGKELSSRLQSSTVNTPEEEVSLFLDSTRILTRHLGLRVELIRWRDGEQMGFHRDRHVDILIERSGK